MSEDVFSPIEEARKEHKLDPVARLSRDLAAAAATLSDHEARFLVDAYYMMQGDRIRANNQVRSLTEGEEPNAVLLWFAAQSETLENQIKRALDQYTTAHEMGSWMRSIYGIGPVISAGLLAHIDIEQAPTVGHIWRYMGYDATCEWISKERAEAWVAEHGADVDAAAIAFNRRAETLRRFATTDKDGKQVKLTGERLARAISRRPWNAALKQVAWKAGESFKKFSGRDECFYGRIYRERKAYEIARNESGGNAAVAAAKLKQYKRDTETRAKLLEGKLSDGQLDLRATRYAVKLFVAHLHGEWYRRHFGAEPPKPYPIAILGHAHEIPPPV